ncbi:MAG: bile acid:sodium symporter family protein [Candidatus Nanohaloarchaea archaeon]
MPLHGLRANLELAILTFSAVAVSYFLTSQVISNVIFTILIGALFFLEGLHLDTDITKDIRNRSRQYILGLIAIFLIAPFVAFIFGTAFPKLNNLLLAIGISAGALGSPRIWSNLSKGDGKLSARIGSVSLLLSVIAVPVLALVLGLDIQMDMLLRNSIVAIIPFLAGIGLQNYRDSWIEEARVHFSKLSFWLIVLITFVQLEFIFTAGAPGFLSEFAEAVIILTGLSLGLFLAGYGFSKLFDHYEKEARAIGFVSGSKNVAVAFLVASLLGPKEVAFVGVYYFIRQLVGVGITDYFQHGELRFLQRLGLKES